MELGSREERFPHVAMIRGDLEKARNTAGAAVSPESDAGKNEPAHDRDGLQSSEPILGKPRDPVHLAIVTRASRRRKGTGMC